MERRVKIFHRTALLATLASVLILCPKILHLNAQEQVNKPQASQSDSQTLQSILIELRAIHADLRLNQTTQILLTEWQLQQATVNTAIQRRDNLRADLAQLQIEENHAKAEASRVEDENSSLPLDPTKKKEVAEIQERLKAILADNKDKQQRLTDDLLDAEQRVRSEQATLDGIQGQLNQVMKSLQNRTP